MTNSTTAVLAAALFAATFPASALTINPDYSSLGTVYQDSTGQLFTSAAAGRSDVTANFKADAATAINYLQGGVLAPWTENIKFTLLDLGFEGAVGDSLVTATDVNGRPSTSAIRVDDGSIQFFVDPTPADNSEFNISNASTVLGGSPVNIRRLGDAVAAGPANGKWDLVTLFVHEIEHSIGFTDNISRFTDVAGATGSAGRKITVPTTLTGFASPFDIPFVPDSAHIDGVTQSGLFNDTVVAQPGFGDSQRALPTGIEFYGLCVVEGCTAAQVNPNLVPEPGSYALILAAGPLLIGLARRRRKQAA